MAGGEEGRGRPSAAAIATAMTRWRALTPEIRRNHIRQPTGQNMGEFGDSCEILLPPGVIVPRVWINFRSPKSA